MHENNDTRKFALYPFYTLSLVEVFVTNAKQSHDRKQQMNKKESGNETGNA